MVDASSLIRSNPALVATAALTIATVVALCIAVVVLSRSRTSLRPVVFFGGFMAIVVGPQLAFHTAQAVGWIPKRDLTWTPDDGTVSPIRYRVNASALAVSGGRFADPVTVFGAAHDPDLVTDLRSRMPDGPLARAQVAEMAILPPSSSLVVAVFQSTDDAERTADAYLRMMTGDLPTVGVDGTRTIVRVNDVAKALVVDRTLFVWTGPDSATVARALAQSALVSREPVGAAGMTDASRDFLLYRPATLVAIVLSLVVCAVVFFFRVAPWAGEVVAQAGATPVSTTEMRHRLMQVNTLDVPFTVEAVDGEPDTLVATWRYADATWIDFARARGLHRTHRILMRLDDERQMVRPIDQTSSLDVSAGRGGANLSWRSERGIVFVHREQQRVFGLQVDERGRLTDNLSYTYRFDLQEMKAPLIEAVTRAGWRWRPALLFGPRWLRWLTQ
ncbi:MAG: hypothetical protein H7099_12810 [Gemmatimonadaceae bacterium]|nr:hypothetical protein [Gemmatimonadaceae bacterium]